MTTDTAGITGTSAPEPLEIVEIYYQVPLTAYGDGPTVPGSLASFNVTCPVLHGTWVFPVNARDKAVTFSRVHSHCVPEPARRPVPPKSRRSS